jgi:hypothetical protein
VVSAFVDWTEAHPAVAPLQAEPLTQTA